MCTDAHKKLGSDREAESVHSGTALLTLSPDELPAIPLQVGERLCRIRSALLGIFLSDRQKTKATKERLKALTVALEIPWADDEPPESTRQRCEDELKKVLTDEEFQKRPAYLRKALSFSRWEQA